MSDNFFWKMYFWTFFSKFSKIFASGHILKILQTVIPVNFFFLQIIVADFLQENFCKLKVEQYSAQAKFAIFQKHGYTLYFLKSDDTRVLKYEIAKSVNKRMFLPGPERPANIQPCSEIFGEIVICCWIIVICPKCHNKMLCCLMLSVRA